MTLPHTFPTAYRRSFVSTVLLSRTWESATVVELRKEAKTRGLSTGNKATLVARIQEHENGVTPATPPIHTSGAIRSASTVVPPPSPQKTVQAASPGIPLAADNAFAHSGFLAIKLPVPSHPLPVTPVQVPYVPDFWNSARPKTVAPLEPELPKLHVVGGSATHYDGGPTYNLEKHREDDLLSTAVETHGSSVRTDVPGFWAEFWESLGLPRSFSARRALSEAGQLAAQAGKDDSRTHSRPLTDEERKGLYLLLGIVGGSWLVGGLVNRRTVVAEGHDTQKQH